MTYSGPLSFNIYESYKKNDFLSAELKCPEKMQNMQMSRGIFKHLES